MERSEATAYLANGPKHCRHYSYETAGHSIPVELSAPLAGIGARCAKGIDLTAPGASRCCWPSPKRVCPKREEPTTAERVEAATRIIDGIERAALIAPLLADKQPGTAGAFKCPCCADGSVRWSRARLNGHFWAACSTPECFRLQQ